MFTRAIFLTTLYAISAFAAALSEQPKLVARTDSRIELVSVLEVLAAKSVPSQADLIVEPNIYSARVEKYFAQFASHEAVNLTAELLAKGHTFDEFATQVLSASPLPALEYFGEPTLENWMNKVRAFARESSFEKFFSENTALYDTMTAALAKTLIAEKIPERVENFTRERKSSYYIYFTPLVISNFRASNEAGNIVIFVGPARVEENMPHFCFHRTPAFVENEIISAFVEGAFAQNADMFGKSAQLASLIRNVYPPEATWQQIVIDHIVTAISIAADNDSFTSALSAVAAVKAGMIFLPEILSAIDHEYAKTENYRNFSQFMPFLAASFLETASNDSTRKLLQPKAAEYVKNEISSIWHIAERDCKRMGFNEITTLTRLDPEKNANAAENTFKCFLAGQDPNDSHYWQVNYQLGKLYLGIRRYSDAQAIFENYTRKQPQGELISGAFWRLGQVREAVGDIEDAKRFYKHALKLDPSLDGARKSLDALEAD